MKRFLSLILVALSIFMCVAFVSCKAEDETPENDTELNIEADVNTFVNGNENNAENSSEIKVEFKGWEQFGKSFAYMGLGMLGIFIVTAIIVLCITALNRIKFIKSESDKK